MDFEAQHLLRQIAEGNRTLASYLKVQNKRIELIGQALTQDLLKDIGPARTVVLSEGGVSFRHDTALGIGTLLTLKLVLLPQGLGLRLPARVTHCAADAEGGFQLGTEFEALTDAQRQLLARAYPAETGAATASGPWPSTRKPNSCCACRICCSCSLAIPPWPRKSVYRWPARPVESSTWPARGEHKHDVLERFGLADQEHPAVGRPPILRWDYREFSVYFENDRVINSVLHHQPTHPAQEQSLP